jgi:GT2 family glycosyltransferase
MKTLSVVIPNYNGASLLRNSLPRVLKAVSRYGGKSEVIVVDDGSSDESCRMVEKFFPQTRLLKLAQNKGFSTACNQGVKIAQSEIVIFLNTDIYVEENFILPLIKHFREKDVFAVVPTIKAVSKNNAIESITSVVFSRGQLLPRWPGLSQTPPKVTRSLPVFYACGGAMGVDKEKFLSLDGFDPLFSPYYVEDTDLSLRAWKRGWRVIYEPESKVCHVGSATIGRLQSKRRNEIIRQRNLFLFQWKNLTSPWLVSQHIFWLIYLLGKSFITRDIVFLLGFILALPRFFPLLWRRLHQRKCVLRSEQEIIKIFASLWEKRK